MKLDNRNTLEFAKRCAVMAERRAPMLPSAPTEEGRTTAEELCHQAEIGLKERLKGDIQKNIKIGSIMN